jgi:hypothetical protein
VERAADLMRPAEHPGLGTPIHLGVMTTHPGVYRETCGVQNTRNSYMSRSNDYSSRNIYRDLQGAEDQESIDI